MNKCLVCGNTQKELGIVLNKKIYRCTNCGFGQTEKLKAHRGEYHRDNTYIEEESFFSNIFQKRVNKIINFKKNGRVLEIGCSTGLMLSMLSKKGWEVIGIEISKEAAGMAMKRGIQVYTEPFENIELSQKFDLIILNHTLEHLENPKKVLEKIYSILAKNGLLYIDVPNFGGLSASIQKGNWPLLLPNEHLWHFTEKSLNILLTELKYKIIYIEKASGIWDLENPLKELLISLVNFKKRFFSELITAFPAFFISKIGIGSDLMIIAKKN